MNAAEIRDALERHWKPSEYLVLHECAEDAMRMGRKIDTLVVSLWKSRGYELDAIEIKVSVSDWMREVNNPEKADFWWNHADRFHVAVPVKIADRVRETLPTGWGLLAVNEGKVAVVVKAAKHDAAPLEWATTVGIMRGASGAGANALVRAREAGEQHGYERGKRDGAGATSDVALAQTVADLRADLVAFEEASGVSVTEFTRLSGARRIGTLVGLVRAWQSDPTWAAKHLASTAEALHKHSLGLTAIAAELLPRQ